MGRVNLSEELKTVDYNYLKELVMDTVDISQYIHELSAYTSHHYNKIRCPLPDHDDSSPSFFYDDAKGVFKCFGCGKGGTVVELHQLMNDLTKEEAIEDLCKENGISIIYKNGRKKKEKKQKGLEYYKSLRDKSDITIKEEKIISKLDRFGSRLSVEDREEAYQLSDKLYVSVGLTKDEKEGIIKRINDLIK